MAKHTQLYDYKAKEPVLLGGTHSQFSTDDGVTWLPLKGAQELGDIGDIAESVECTTIDDDRKVYCGGLKDSAEKELTIYYYDDDADQQALIAAAEAQQTVQAGPGKGSNDLPVFPFSALKAPDIKNCLDTTVQRHDKRLHG